MKRILVLFLFLLSLVVCGCKSKERLDEDTFVNVYTDLIIAEDTVDVSKNFKNEIFKKYNISEKTYTNTVNYYNDKPEKWQKFFEKVEDKVTNMGKKPAKK